MQADNYVITERAIKEPPTSFFGKLRFLGPGFILSASIVGSGELIATTTLGAKAGFVAFWIILLSCLVKVAVQLEFGKQAILTGQTAMKSFSQLPGPGGRSNWAVWTTFVLMTFKTVQIAGILGGTAIVLHMLFPSLSIGVWAVITALIAAGLIFKGYYNIIEKSSLVMIVSFTVLTITAVFVLRYTEYSFSWKDVSEGLSFKFPPEIVAVAFGAFGITGVGSDEIIAYNYWCIEKGYAAFTGPRTDTSEWKRRAQGWIRVMYLDAGFAMVIYTCVTAAFYLLGAAVLHNRTAMPEGTEVIETLALIYTQSIGPGAKTVYLVGALFVLFSSVFAALAAWTRFYSDAFGQLGWINFSDLKQRKKVISLLAWGFPFLWAAVFLFIKLPLLMILSGGVVGSVLLFLVVYAVVYFHRKRVQAFPSGLFYNFIFFLSVISIIGVGVYGIVQLF